MTSEITEAP
ncbi:hypothetical protein VTL71DRAFT_14621 [Oculimacula yallundae]|uniref:Uncharacterized protein n=1 Tax=Oculimacula yallundae TaxID=86028 RepID=A0ABR4CIZ9_9HELO